MQSIHYTTGSSYGEILNSEWYQVSEQSNGLAGPQVLLVEFRESSSDLVPDLAKSDENLFITPCRFRWISKTKVQPGFHVAGEGGTVLIRVIAHGDDVVEPIRQKLLNVSWASRTDINPNLFHHLNCRGMHFGRGMGSCGLDLEDWVERFEEAFRHLASGRIAGAKHEDSGLLRHCYEYWPSLNLDH